MKWSEISATKIIYIQHKKLSNEGIMLVFSCLKKCWPPRKTKHWEYYWQLIVHCVMKLLIQFPEKPFSEDNRLDWLYISKQLFFMHKTDLVMLAFIMSHYDAF